MAAVNVGNFIREQSEESNERDDGILLHTGVNISHNPGTLAAELFWNLEIFRKSFEKFLEVVNEKKLFQMAM